ncbi:hypothetical protein [Streptomyces sp. SAS_275]|uniref:hypothetical protein n=1 Tax=Streptomyces sp. SAS_275 TaxID=3412746 RepID=UPI00403CDE72
MRIRPELIRAAAAIWQEAAAAGEDPTKAVHAAYPDRSRRTIDRWVHAARTQGLLPASKPGSTWLRTPDAEAVAEALDVPYERLVIALREHANGYLRIGVTEEQHARAALVGEVLAVTSTLHVTPIRDAVGHDTSTAGADCVCGPEVRPAPQDDGSTGWLLVHHSLDGREQGDR